MKSDPRYIVSSRLPRLERKMRLPLLVSKNVNENLTARPHLDIAVGTTRYKSFSCRAQRNNLYSAGLATIDGT